MTCIIGLVHGDRIYIGGDRAATSEDYTRSMQIPKVFKLEKMIFGYAGSIRLGQLLQYSLKLPLHNESHCIEKYMATTFIDAVRKLLLDKGFTTVTNGKEEGGSFLVGYKGKLFEVCSDFQITEWVGQFAVIGSGDKVASGAMAALYKESPKRRIKRSLEITAEFINNVRGPFDVISIHR